MAQPMVAGVAGVQSRSPGALLLSVTFLMLKSVKEVFSFLSFFFYILLSVPRYMPF